MSVTQTGTALDNSIVDNTTWTSLSESVVRIFAIPVIATAIFLFVVLLPLRSLIPDDRYRLLGKVVIFFIIVFIVDRIIVLATRPSLPLVRTITSNTVVV